MKPFLLAVLNLLVGAGSIAHAMDDPVQNYLSTFSPLGGTNKFYSNDRLLRLDLDLDNDGRKEVLLSMARDRNGKQGNIWAVYTRTGNGYSQAGGMTFNHSRFYLGLLGDGRYGL